MAEKTRKRLSSTPFTDDKLCSKSHSLREKYKPHGIIITFGIIVVVVVGFCACRKICSQERNIFFAIRSFATLATNNRKKSSSWPENVKFNLFFCCALCLGDDVPELQKKAVRNIFDKCFFPGNGEWQKGPWVDWTSNFVDYISTEIDSHQGRFQRHRDLSKHKKVKHYEIVYCH